MDFNPRSAPGMANTTTPRKFKKFSTSSDNDGSASWSNLDENLLLLIMTQVGVFDFIALSGVCKSWRSVAVSNWSKCMVSKQPMYLYISRCLNQKDCYLEDYKRRKMKTTIPHSNGRICIGLTCGYLIFYGKKTQDFWLVNPLTRKKLHFPGFTFAVRYSAHEIRGILVFSPSMSGWVFVVAYRLFTQIYFSLPGKQARWRYISSNSPIYDLHFFKGKIYMIDISLRLWELRLNPEPTLTLREMMGSPWHPCNNLVFLSSDEKLYVMNTVRLVGQLFVAFEVDLNEMKWVKSERTIGEYAVFLSELKCDAAIKPDTWTRPWTQYERLNYSQYKKGMRSTRKLWYFPHDCLNDNNSDMENGVFPNILKE